MERKLGLFLSLGLIFGTLVAQAMPKGSPKDYVLKTKYSCQTNGISAFSRDSKLRPRADGEVKYIAVPGKTQALTFGSHREYMVWPRITRDSFNRTLNVLVREKSGTYKIVQEIDMGETQKTKTSVSMTLKTKQGEERPVSCNVEMEWLKK